MRAKFLGCLLLVAPASLPLWAGVIPYPNIGTTAPTVALTATATGSVTGYFYGSSAADEDQIRMCDLTQSYCSPYVFDNHTTAPGASYVFDPSVVAGDVLVFDLKNLATQYIYSSDPSRSADGINHAYVTSYSGAGGPAGIPAGTFIGMEDLYIPVPSDRDYNDVEFVFTNVGGGILSEVPEPGTLALLGSGLLGLFLARRRRA